MSPRSSPLLLLLLAIALHQSNAQKCGANAQSTIATDRPQITNSSIVVPCGSLQFENGFQETSNGGRRGYDLPETSIRLGVAKKTELRVAVPDYFYDDDTGSAFASGFGDLVLGLKQQLGPSHGFDISLIPSLSLPSGAAPISSHGYDAALQMPWSRSLSKNWTAAGQLAVMWPTESGRHNTTGQASVYFDRQLTSPWDAYVEYSGAFPNAAGRSTPSTSAPHISLPHISSSTCTATSGCPRPRPSTPSVSATRSASRPSGQKKDAATDTTEY